MRRWLPMLPNLISGVRILLVVPIALALAHHRLITALWLFAVAGVSDGVDGFLARHFGWQTELGGLLDPLADKLMLATVFVMLAVFGAVPFWLTAMVIARDCIIVLGAIAYRVLVGPVPARPSAISKFNTLCQILFVVTDLATEQFAWPKAWALTLGAMVFVTVVVSGIDYVWVYGRQAFTEARARRATLRTGGAPPGGAPRAGGSTPA